MRLRGRVVCLMTVMKPALHVLTGCTAVGKTEWALRWAATNEAEIVSCDSLLFYRGMDLGTAKPTPAERMRVRHHLVDICGFNERMDVTRYIAEALKAVADIQARGRRVLVVGGSGFYLKSFFAPVADDVTVSPEVRTEVTALSPADALRRLHSLNPGGLGSLDLANPRRVARALERCLSSGRPVAELAADFARRRGPFSEWEIQLVRIDQPPAVLNERIESRVSAMLSAGLIDEVRGLLAAGLKDNPSAARAIGYREVISFLEGTLPGQKLAAEIAKNTRALVKKQRTWFRTQLPAHRVVMAAEAGAEGLFSAREGP
ncbi:MAG: tRNA delta(2)-isopentenylpyrophosphate transferase [Verrucomicrobia bacterium]|nr:tRNA delta(2)-isopentenylpyrophosphate transferase [Verrucomicrobiota bacterium]